MHGTVKEKPMTTPSSKSKRKRGKMTPTILSVESTQEDLPSIGCRIRMCVGYDDKGKMSATIITPKEDVDHQFWYPKKNRVINEYKHIKDYYSWSDEVEKESEYATGATSPKIYDLRTPQKKSGTKKTYSSDFSIQPTITNLPRQLWIQSLQTQFLEAIGFLLCLQKQISQLWIKFYWRNPLMLSTPKQVQLIKLNNCN